MQTTIIFEYPKREIVSYQKAVLMASLTELKAKYEKDRATYWHMMGKRRGAWGRMTMADEKRGQKLDQLKSRIETIQLKLSKSI